MLGPILYDTSVAHRLRGSKSERARKKGRDRSITTYLEVAPQPLPHSQDTFDAFKRETCTYLGKNKKLPRPTCNYIRISIKSFVARISLCREAEAVKRRKKKEKAVRTIITVIITTITVSTIRQNNGRKNELLTPIKNLSFSFVHLVREIVIRGAFSL